jgi:hypothetical protein
VGLEWGPLSLVSTVEELLGSKRSRSGLDIRGYGNRDLPRCRRDKLHPYMLALTSPTSGGRSLGIVQSLTQGTGISFSSVRQMNQDLRQIKSNGIQRIFRKKLRHFLRVWRSLL